MLKVFVQISVSETLWELFKIYIDIVLKVYLFFNWEKDLSGYLRAGHSSFKGLCTDQLPLCRLYSFSLEKSQWTPRIIEGLSYFNLKL